MEIDKNLLQKVAQYKPDPLVLRTIADKPVVFTVGIVAAGKNTVASKLIELYPEEYRFIVSHTTRKPRANHGVMERDGVEYHFIDFAAAEQLLDSGAYVEANIIHYENIYGVTIGEIRKIQDGGKIPLGDLDIKGVQNCVNLGLHVKAIFLLPPSYEVWWERLQKRYGETVDWRDVRLRVKTTLEELEFVLARDYFYLIINDDLDRTVELSNRIAHGEPVPSDPRATQLIKDLTVRMRNKLAYWAPDGHP